MYGLKFDTYCYSLYFRSLEWLYSNDCTTEESSGNVDVVFAFQCEHHMTPKVPSLLA